MREGERADNKNHGQRRDAQLVGYNLLNHISLGGGTRALQVSAPPPGPPPSPHTLINLRDKKITAFEFFKTRFPVLDQSLVTASFKP